MAILQESNFKTKMDLEINLRSPTVGEGEVLAELMRTILRTSRHTLTTAEEFTFTGADEDKMIANYLEAKDKIMIVPYFEGSPIGFMDFRSGSRRRNSHLGDFGMSLLEQYRGQGISSKMLSELIAWAKTVDSIEKIELEVHAKYQSALHLYQKHGFEIEGTQVRGIKFDDGSYDDVISMGLFI